MNIVDILIHIHPELSAEQRMEVESEVGTRQGVLSIHFSGKYPHELTAAYNPDVVNSATILDLVRKWDPEATMAGL